jgi:hypothetical protein
MFGMRAMRCEAAASMAASAAFTLGTARSGRSPDCIGTGTSFTGTGPVGASVGSIKVSAKDAPPTAAASAAVSWITLARINGPRSGSDDGCHGNVSPPRNSSGLGVGLGLAAAACGALARCAPSIIRVDER